ncbi:MAG TPA: phospholipase D-like domain-containing protein [Candidatus Polarisedimenticolaceae bacterium]|nr:phospholipase D-like domain-containing protein [Candidatus Polarisedimenticolaceae bacterium]
MSARVTPPAAGSARLLADQALERAAGAPLIGGNAVRVLKDAGENFPAWKEAIAGAKRFILFESYIFDHDRVGIEFRDALAVKAASGVKVRVLYDWLGSPKDFFFSRFWRPLRDAGATVRAFNPPRLDSPFGWIRRDHRKSIAIDGRVGFVSGLCASGDWEGHPERGQEPWRDTGIEIRGPAVADVERAFAQVWSAAGDPIPPEEATDPASIPREGEVDLRVVAGAPNAAELFRLDQFIAAIARERLWLTDAYFVPLSLYVEALRSAARDGVDVRLLLPGSSDLPLVRPLSRAGYRPLLEAGVRVFEWNGTMLHAKTAVADGRWARVGSTNLNFASFVGNYELDVAIEDEGVAAELERLYAADLDNATEIVLKARRLGTRVMRAADRPRRASRESSARGATAGALRLGKVVGGALTQPRELGNSESRALIVAAFALLALTAVAIRWPHAIAWPFAVIMAWLALSYLIRAWRSWNSGRRKGV